MSILSEELVKSIYEKCIVSTDLLPAIEDVEEIAIDEQTHTSILVIEGRNKIRYKFNKQRVLGYSDLIRILVGEVKDIDSRIEIKNLSLDKNNNIWTEDSRVSEMLALIGLVSRNLFYCYPMIHWDNLPDSISQVTRNYRDIFRCPEDKLGPKIKYYIGDTSGFEDTIYR